MDFFSCFPCKKCWLLMQNPCRVFVRPSLGSSPLRLLFGFGPLQPFFHAGSTWPRGEVWKNDGKRGLDRKGGFNGRGKYACISSIGSKYKGEMGLLGNTGEMCLQINQNLPLPLQPGFGGNIRIFLIIFLGQVLRS